MVKDQNIYTVIDHSHCPDGEGEYITKFLETLYLRISEKLTSLDNPVDWLIVKSDSLEGITWSSQGFFEEMFEKALKSNFKRDIKVIKNHSRDMGGAVGTKDIKNLVIKYLGTEEVSLNYLNRVNLGTGFVVYHLDMRN
ncbi:hypothetical protein GOV13_00465 [Candidatus Pacearchaeota archaeon]|nr:hypothetical protein [Candidatus Pacearchaeota archaeon]